jgi:hypothetical protein
VYLKGSGQQSGDPECLWIPGLTGLRGMAQQNRDCAYVGPGLGKPWGAGFWSGYGAGFWSGYYAGLCRTGGHSPGTEIVPVCIPCVAGLGGMAQQSRDRPGLCRPWGHGPAEIMQAGAGLAGCSPAKWSLCRPVQAWRARPSGTEVCVSTVWQAWWARPS